ncbi:MAG: radical SAM protein [Patescibacteria group bacterium]|nr:radical SAM protein [Patescibacteria group bacterium]
MKFYLFVLGCQMNVSDAERLRFLLTNLGLKETSDAKNADIILTVACSVRQKPIDRIWGKFKIWQSFVPRPKIILTGCVVEADRKKFIEKFDLVFDIQKPQELISFLKKIHPQLRSYGGLACWPKTDSLFDLNPMRQTRDRAYISIGNGCNNFCTYCVVPYTRGREIYRPMREIIKEAREALKNGAKIISLIAQNVNSYKDPFVIPAIYGEYNRTKAGIHSAVILNESEESPAHAGTRIRERLPRRFAPRNDNEGKDFVELLKKINNIPGYFKIEFLTSHPKDMSDELIKTVAKLDKVIKWIHLPVQAGSDEILEKMNRKYTREHYLKLVKKIRKVMPKVVLTTDIIVGFPSETKAQFEETVDLAKTAKFDQAFVSKYSPRAGTVAAKMDNDVSPAEKKRRFRILDKLINHKKIITYNNRVIPAKAGIQKIDSASSAE